MPLEEPSRLIKARSARHLGSATAFNFDDMRRQCDEYVSRARQQGEQLLARSTTEAEEIRRRAHAEGLAAGQRDGLATAQQLIESRAAEIAAQQTQDRLRTALPAFQALAKSLEIERDRWISHWEKSAVELCATIAEKILRHELSRQPELAVEIIQEALQLAAGQLQLKLRLHPADIEVLHVAGQEALSRLASMGQAELVPDESITRGGCQIETRHGVIDARLETQLERITLELLEGA
ncbi:MAG TPA: FliH/SctL family protein [Planctomycetaceae bacterium]|jgi:flagellar assembly protein FliH